MDDSMHADEYALIKECRDGNAERYAVLVERYKDMAFGIAYRMLGDADAANDMAQEAFIAAYAGLKNFQYRSKFSSWLVSILVNKCRDSLRARRDSVSIDEIAESASSREATPEQAAASRQAVDAVQRSLNALPDEYREAIVLKHIEGLEYREMSGILGESVNALKVRVHRGRNMLKTLLLETGVVK